ncbi:hypothetical protein [Kitasatospora sp. NPDC094015]|uniref:hypothetical protein n=1 Tax=Kitasatospora sp. NPDC094015 TaxID=3155205 RepID=UPI0033299ECA
MTTSVGTCAVPGANGSPESLPTSRRGQLSPRTASLPPAPPAPMAAPMAAPTAAPVADADAGDQLRRAPGARCRLAMDYLD